MLYFWSLVKDCLKCEKCDKALEDKKKLESLVQDLHKTLKEITKYITYMNERESKKNN